MKIFILIIYKPDEFIQRLHYIVVLVDLDKILMQYRNKQKLVINEPKPWIIKTYFNLPIDFKVEVVRRLWDKLSTWWENNGKINVK